MEEDNTDQILTAHTRILFCTFVSISYAGALLTSMLWKVSGSVPGWTRISLQLLFSVCLCGFSPPPPNIPTSSIFIWRGSRLRSHVGVALAEIFTLKLDKTQHMRESRPAQSSIGERLFINEDPRGALLNTAGRRSEAPPVTK